MTNNGYVRQPLTSSYRPTVHGNRIWGWADGDEYFTLADVERMRRDPQVQMGLRILCSPLAGVQWLVKGDPKVTGFVDKQLARFWQNAMLPIARTMFAYGFAPAEICFRGAKQIKYKALKHIHPFDARPLEYVSGPRAGEFAGIQVRMGPARGHQYANQVEIANRHSFWIANDPEYGSLYGRSRLAGAYLPWAEKRDRRGAVSARSLWYMKNAFHGGVMRHPDGMTEVDGGGTISNRELAREILEKFETGGVLALPNAMDDKGNYLWVYEPPSINGDLNGILDYISQLDREVLVGLQIPPELVDAATVGSGYSGRAIPAQVFFSSLDETVANIITSVDEQIIKPITRLNFGKAEYLIEPQSLAKLVAKDASDAGQPPPQNPVEAAAAPPEMRMSMGALSTRFPELFARAEAAAAARYPDEPTIVPVTETIRMSASQIADQVVGLYHRAGDTSIPMAEIQGIMAQAKALSKADLLKIADRLELLGMNNKTKDQIMKTIWWKIESRRSNAQRAEMIREGGTWMFSTAHAPKGGITIGGEPFEGGEFIPDDDLAKATPKQRKELGVETKADKKQGKAKAGASKSDGKTSPDSSDKFEEQARKIVKGKIKVSKKRAWDGRPTGQPISKDLAGAIAEEVLIQYLKSEGFKDAKKTSEHVKTAMNNLPFDLIEDHRLIEAKGGQTGKPSGVWALKYDGRFTKQEEAAFAKMSPDQVKAAKKRINAAKVAAIHKRKKEFLQKLSKQLGYKIKPCMMTTIINPETKTVDIYRFDGLYDRITWDSEMAKTGYVASVRYG